jgi:sugar-specific transcriptional regulator TrmB
VILLLTEKSYKQNKTTLLTGEENFLFDAPLRQLLISYGLTKNQARILCILNQNKTHLSVKQISHLSNIARESIYQVLFDLKEKGLIEKAITTPKKYKAIPLKTILQILHHQKTSQIFALEKLTKQVLFNHNNILENDNITERFQYVLVPKKRQFIERINHTIFNSKEKVRIKTHLKRYLQAVNMHKEIYQESFTNAIHNGVRFQVIIGLESKEEKIPEEIKLLSKSQNISVKLDDTAPAMAMAIVDEKEIFLINEPSSNLEESSALWSNNHILVEVLSTCFDSFWKKASSITH